MKEALFVMHVTKHISLKEISVLLAAMTSKNASTVTLTKVALNAKRIITLKEGNASKIHVQALLGAFTALTPNHAILATKKTALWIPTLMDSVSAIRTNGSTKT